MSKLADSPAFPVPHKCDSEGWPIYQSTGMTLRQHYAGIFEAALLSNLADIRCEGFKASEIEEFALMRADALIAALEQPK